MRIVLTGIHGMFLLILILGVLTLSAAQAPKEPPEQLVFESKLGNVTFQHTKHVEREGAECSTCHDTLFPQSRAPINFKKGMHKPAEAKKESCAACHVAEGKAFESKGNCRTCHVKK